jgi:hypothetical protein
MKITTQQWLNILQILSWIILVGVCFEAGGFLVNTFITLVVNPVDAKYFWPRVDLSSLYSWDRGYFIMETGLMCLVAICRVWIFWLIVKILQEKKLDMYQPFNKEVGRFIGRISWLSLLTGLFSWWGAKYAAWFIQQGVTMPELQYLRIGGADVWLFMGVTLYVIAQIFKRGIEIQTENELTV